MIIEGTGLMLGSPWVRWGHLVPMVAPYADSASTEVIASALHTACVDFCAQTRWVLRSFEIVSTGQQIYDLPQLLAPTMDHAPDPFILWPECVHVDRQSYSILGLSCIDEAYFALKSNIVFVMGSTLRFQEPPATGASIMVFAATTACSKEGVIKPLVDRFGETIAHGARYRLHSQVGKPWSSQSMAANAVMLYKHGRDRARIERNTYRSLGSEVA